VSGTAVSGGAVAWVVSTGTVVSGGSVVSGGDVAATVVATASVVGVASVDVGIVDVASVTIVDVESNDAVVVVSARVVLVSGPSVESLESDLLPVEHPKRANPAAATCAPVRRAWPKNRMGRPLPGDPSWGVLRELIVSRQG